MSKVACIGTSGALVVTLLVAIFVSVTVPRAEAVRAFFVFGDSLVDSGNNNYLDTTARADSPPYGIDYPTHMPTGRFSNGLNLPDIISEKIGSTPTLPYLSPALTGPLLLVGANFASAGVGILNDTGVQFANIISIARQLQYFQQYKQRLGALIGVAPAQQWVNQALVLITLGGNDWVNNYFLPTSARPRRFNIPQYSQYLISEYKKVLKRLHELGARRVLVTSTGPLGCVPAELAASGSRNGECAPRLQQAATTFNPELFQMLKELNGELGSDVFVAANAFQMKMNFINNPGKFGFVSSKVACCGQGPYNGAGICNQASNLCSDRSAYAFWDPFHPSERAIRLIVEQILSGSTQYMSPMNLSTIMALDSLT